MMNIPLTHVILPSAWSLTTNKANKPIFKSPFIAKQYYVLDNYQQLCQFPLTNDQTHPLY